MDIGVKRWPSVSWVLSWPGARVCPRSRRPSSASAPPKRPASNAACRVFWPTSSSSWSRCGPAVVPLWSRCGPAVVPLWSHWLGQLLRFWRDRRLLFVLDATALDDRATVLYLGLLVHSRLLPVSWQVLPVHQQWEQRQWEVVGALLDRVIPHLGAAECTLVADRGLVGHPLVRLCAQRGWH